MLFAMEISQVPIRGARFRLSPTPIPLVSNTVAVFQCMYRCYVWNHVPSIEFAFLKKKAKNLYAIFEQVQGEKNRRVLRSLDSSNIYLLLKISPSL